MPTAGYTGYQWGGKGGEGGGAGSQIAPGYLGGGGVGGGGVGVSGWTWGVDLERAYKEGGLKGLREQAKRSIEAGALRMRFPGLSDEAYGFLTLLPKDPTGQIVFDYNGIPISLDWLAQNIANRDIPPTTFIRWAKGSKNPMAQFTDPETGRVGSKITNPTTGETYFQPWSSIPGHISFYYQAQKSGAERGAPSSETDIFAPTSTGEVNPRGWGGMKSREQIEEENRAKQIKLSPRMTWALYPSQRGQPAVSRYTPPTRWLVY